MAKLNTNNRNQHGADGFKLGNELIGLLSIFIGLLFILSLATFDYRDPWFNHAVSEKIIVHNKAGLFGSYTGGLLYDLGGYAAWLVPALFCFVGARRILGVPPWAWWRWTGLCFVFIVLSFVGASRDNAMLQAAVIDGSIVINHGGGIIGHAIYNGLVAWLSPTGAWLIWTLCLLLSIQVMAGFSWLVLVAHFTGFLIQTSRKMAEDMIKEHHTKKERAIALESNADNPDHFALPSSLFGKADDSSSLHTLEAKSEPVATSATQEVPQEPEEAPQKNFFRSLFSSSKEETVENLDLPPWVDEFEQVEPQTDEAQDETLRPDFSTVSTHTPHPPQQPAEDDALLTILESYESSLQEQSSLQNEPPFTPERTAEEPAIQHPVTPQPAVNEPQDTPLLVVPEEENTTTSLESPLDAEEAIVTVPSLAVPIRDKAPDSVLPAQVEQEDVETPVVRKKMRLPLPSLELLEAIPQSSSKTPYAVLEQKANDLMTCLADFGIQGELVGITPGPVITMFEIRPAPGVRVARIANLSDDLALALKAVAVRIQAPVPGTDTVGVEIPNEVREVVCLRQILGSETFEKSKSLLSIALGKDIAGHPTVADLATMPHLLVAGATGAGKSVGINSIILSLLYKATPDEVRLLLVDPKRVEMAIYADLPHLVHPVVTEMQLAKNALDWAVREMDDRYTILAQAQVRNITDYNAKLKEHAQKPIPEMEGLESMPYLVIIIDELADLMLTAAKEVETSIVRLAQLARAAGIHLILATQRPSVDVVTGIIKANFPCRIAFQVTSKHDSRTILDTVGAEHLLGKGDMLFKPSGGRFQRMHGAFVNDKNVKKVVDYWKSLKKPQFDIDFADFGTSSSEASGNGQSEIYDDPVYDEAVEFVTQQGKASISLIQRRFRIGFNKAARIIEQMEYDGIVGPQEGSKPRAVLR